MTGNDEDQRSRVPISKRLVAINSVSSILAKLVNVAVLLWTYQYLISRVPVEEFATYSVVLAITTILSVFFTIFTSALSRFVVEAYAKGDRSRVT